MADGTLETGDLSVTPAVKTGERVPESEISPDVVLSEIVGRLKILLANPATRQEIAADVLHAIAPEILNASPNLHMRGVSSNLFTALRGIFRLPTRDESAVEQCEEAQRKWALAHRIVPRSNTVGSLRRAIASRFFVPAFTYATNKTPSADLDPTLKQAAHDALFDALENFNPASEDEDFWAYAEPIVQQAVDAAWESMQSDDSTFIPANGDSTLEAWAARNGLESDDTNGIRKRIISANSAFAFAFATVMRKDAHYPDQKQALFECLERAAFQFTPSEHGEDFKRYVRPLLKRVQASFSNGAAQENPPVRSAEDLEAELEGVRQKRVMEYLAVVDNGGDYVASYGDAETLLFGIHRNGAHRYAREILSDAGERKPKISVLNNAAENILRAAIKTFNPPDTKANYFVAHYRALVKASIVEQYNS